MQNWHLQKEFTLALCDFVLFCTFALYWNNRGKCLKHNRNRCIYCWCDSFANKFVPRFMWKSLTCTQKNFTPAGCLTMALWRVCSYENYTDCTHRNREVEKWVKGHFVLLKTFRFDVQFYVFVIVLPAAATFCSFFVRFYRCYVHKLYLKNALH